MTTYLPTYLRTYPPYLVYVHVHMPREQCRVNELGEAKRGEEEGGAVRGSQYDGAY